MSLGDTLAPYFQSTEEGIKFVGSLDDMPVVGDGVIRLIDNFTYFLTKSIDLEGHRIIAGRNTTIIGGSSENCILSSTGLNPATALITSEWSLPMRNMALSHGTALDLDANGNANQALDWFGVNFLNCATVGRIANYTNFIMTDSGLLNSANMTFDGNFGTVGFNQCIFDGLPGQTTLNFPATLTITRRIRVIYSAFVSLAGETSVNVDVAATIPVDSYILDTVNFSGGGTYTAGVQYDDNKSLFANCRGVENSSEVANYGMRNNLTATPIAVVGTATKALGTTTSYRMEKFTHSNNRATYTGALSRSFRVLATFSCTSGNNNQIGCYIAKNGIVQSDSEIYVTTNGAGRAESVTIQTVVDLVTGDFVEVWVENETSTTSVTVTYLNVTVVSIN